MSLHPFNAEASGAAQDTAQAMPTLFWQPMRKSDARLPSPDVTG